MTEKETFLKQIRDNPKDDTVRLAYADWLDEHENLRWWPGFIRLQIQKPKNWRRQIWGDSTADQVVREIGLKGACARLGGNLSFAGYTVELRRGFPAAVRCGPNMAPFLRDAGRLFAWPIERVYTHHVSDPNVAFMSNPWVKLAEERVYEWWFADDDTTHPGLLPARLLRKMAALYAHDTDRVYTNDEKPENAVCIEFRTPKLALQALARTLLTYGRERFVALSARGARTKG